MESKPMIILAGTMFLIGLSSLLLFKGIIWTGILMLLCAVLLLVLRLFFSKKIKKPILYGIYVIGIGGFIVFAFLGSGRVSPFGVDHYAERLNELSMLLEEEKPEKALIEVQELRNDLGDSDALYLLEARAYIESGDPGRARTVLDQMTEKDSASYYLYKAASLDAEGNYEEEGKVLMEGAKKNPESMLLNYRAGCAAAAQREFVAADYYLYQALTTNYDGNLYTPLMLALVRYERGNLQDAYTLMAYAEEKGALELPEYQNQEAVQWYLAQKEVQ